MEYKPSFILPSKDEDLKRNIGNQFVWCKYYGEGTVKFHDEFSDKNWISVADNNQATEFIEGRKIFINELLK